MEEEIVKEAWRLRRMGVYTMREIATRLGVERQSLIHAMTTKGKVLQLGDGKGIMIDHTKPEGR